jgi:Cof subfamily protein (haloacid dehalogenase superfamily)
MSMIALVVSDVDGTLVTPDKRLTDASIRAARALADRGIAFTVVSSRPPIGMRMLVEPLALRLPIGVFSGSGTVTPTLEVVEQHFIPEASARKAAGVLAEFAIDVWLYTAHDWLACDAQGPYVALEKRTIEAGPVIVADLASYFGQACKIVGASGDFAKLDACEAAMHTALNDHVFIARSQRYYLDLTPAGRNKGTFVAALSARLGVARETIAVLGDMENDLAMFEKAGVSIAMGNATAAVKRQATYVTASNTEDGFAAAIERYIIADAT